MVQIILENMSQLQKIESASKTVTNKKQCLVVHHCGLLLPLISPGVKHTSECSAGSLHVRVAFEKKGFAPF